MTGKTPQPTPSCPRTAPVAKFDTLGAEPDGPNETTVSDTRDPFADDVLERLVRSNQDYQRSHGHYIVPLAERLLAARAEVERCWRELDEAKALLATAYDDFNGNGHPTNSWRKRVEDIGAWPKRTATS